MSKKVDKIKVVISQKMNLGNYETRDYTLGINISGFDPESKEEIKKTIDFGRELCLEDVSRYYKKVKDGLQQGEPLKKGADKKYLAIEEKIKKSEGESQLKTLIPQIKGIEDKKMQLVIQKIFNLKLISFKE